MGSLVQAQRLARAVRHGGLDALALFFAGIFVDELHIVVPADLEDPGGRLDAPGVSLAQVAVHRYLHRASWAGYGWGRVRANRCPAEGWFRCWPRRARRGTSTGDLADWVG